jgi:hypothetical protein
MKKWILITGSESGDSYMYFILSENEPDTTKFLEAHANDKDEEGVWEYPEILKEIKDENFIEWI